MEESPGSSKKGTERKLRLEASLAGEQLVSLVCENKLRTESELTDLESHRDDPSVKLEELRH
ncbi:MAG TPA: hypothetical protein VI819_04900 [Patescibacteria group bacterium]|nr:hypothetical protein [Patescibacteria group bacterium]